MFDQKKTKALPPLYKVRTDYLIKLEKNAKGKKKKVL
jgi:hypothetical protein